MPTTKLDPPVFQSQRNINGVHVVRLLAPKFDSNVIQASINRSMVRAVNEQGKPTWKLIREDIVNEGTPEELNKLPFVLDEFVPGGLFFYSAVAHYKGGAQQSYSLMPVLIP